MAITVSDGLKTAAVNQAGSVPVAKIEIWPISGAISESKGLTRRIYDGYSILATNDDLLWTDTSTRLLAFNYGSSPPLGINPAMLSDGQSWSIRWDGYFKCTRPAGVTGSISYNFGYVSTGHVIVYTGSSAIDDDPGVSKGSGSSPHSINDVGQVVLYQSADDLWLPMTIWYARSDVNNSNRVLAEERFVFFWRDSVDEEWQILGSDRSCPVGGRFFNLSGTPVTSVDAALQSPAINVYTLNLHSVGGAFHFHKSTDVSTEYGVVAGQSTTYTLEGAGTQSGIVAITWADDLTHGDVVEVHMIAGNETPWSIPATNLTVDTSVEGASTLRFSVPVTEVAFNERAVTRTNFSTYDLDTDSFGVIRPNRMIRASMGYIVDGQPEYVTRFTGLIQDIEPDHQIDANGTPSITLDITCIDSRTLGTRPPITKIEDMILGAIPSELSYDIAQRYAETTGALGGDGAMRPPAFDSWNLATVVRTVLYQAGFNATQLWAKDSNGNFLIDDRSVYLEQSPAYPFSLTSELGSSFEIGTFYEEDRRERNMGGAEKFLAGFLQAITFGRFGSENPTAVKKDLWTEFSTVKEAPYLYMFGLDSVPWDEVREVCSTYGLELGIDVDGNVYMRYPNNPVLYNAVERHTMPTLTYQGGWAESDFAATIGNDVLTTLTAGQVGIAFEGVGIELIFTRLNSTSKATVEIDGIVVDGINELDATTGDMGHVDWTDNVVMPGSYVNLKYDDLVQGVSHWYYRDGTHPDFGDNPTIFTICDNLTYGNHTFILRWYEGLIWLEGFRIITVSTEQPRHEFDSIHNLLGVTLNASLATAANDIIIAGNMRGAVGDYILSRAVDMASIYDEDSPNYIGVRKPWYIADPRITNQERADFLAQHLLLRYRRGERNPVVQSSGLPWVETGDPVTIRDMHEASDGSFIPTIGLYSPGDLTKLQRIGTQGILPLPFQRYWIKEATETFAVENDVPKYIATMTTTALPPLPAYEPLPEPVQDESVTAISGIDITYDAGGASYNPFTSDADGEFVNIEFNLNWHARSLNVSIVVAQPEIDLPGGDKMRVGALVNILAVKTGFVPAGQYQFQWDGWMEGENGGLFAPDGEYSVQIETERYSTGAGFYCRAESGYPGVISGSEDYIIIAQDRDAVYGADPFSLALSPTAAPNSPPLLYDLETNDGLGLQITVTLAAPAQILIPITVSYTNQTTVPANDPGASFIRERMTIHLRGNDTPIMEPGTYTFYFNPLLDVTKAGRQILPFGTEQTLASHTNYMLRHGADTSIAEQGARWFIAWHFDINVKCVDKSGTVTGVDPATPTWDEYNWGGPRAASFAKAERSDANVTWSFLDAKAAV